MYFNDILFQNIHKIIFHYKELTIIYYLISFGTRKDNII